MIEELRHNFIMECVNSFYLFINNIYNIYTKKDDEIKMAVTKKKIENLNLKHYNYM